MAEKPKIRATAGSGRGGAVTPYKKPEPPSGGKNVPATKGNSNTAERTYERIVRSNAPAETMRTVGSSSTVGTGKALPSAAKAAEAVSKTGSAAGRALKALGKKLPYVGGALSVYGAVETIKDAVNKDYTERRRLDAEKRNAVNFPRGNPSGRAAADKVNKDAAESAQKSAASFPRGNPSSRSAPEKTSTSPSKSTPPKITKRTDIKLTPESENRLAPNATLGDKIAFYMAKGMSRADAAKKAKGDG